MAPLLVESRLLVGLWRAFAETLVVVLAGLVAVSRLVVRPRLAALRLVDAGAGRRFAAIVVANYLHRPLFPRLESSLEEGGVLIYETFMAGNERFGRPSNPAFLLKPGELLAAFAALSPVAFEQGRVERPKPAMVQRLCARKGALGEVRIAE